jgi:hypothetical protein
MSIMHEIQAHESVGAVVLENGIYLYHHGEPSEIKQRQAVRRWYGCIEVARLLRERCIIRQ